MSVKEAQWKHTKVENQTGLQVSTLHLQVDLVATHYITNTDALPYILSYSSCKMAG